jgi:serine phosphatase RsbU (regulator of sigma subunit)
MPRGSLVGIIADAAFEEREVLLAIGDTLVLYSDGVTETRSAEREEFGMGRLKSLLESIPGAPADTIATAIESALAEFRDGPLRDDVALLVVSFVGQAPTESSAEPRDEVGSAGGRA